MQEFTGIYEFLHIKIAFFVDAARLYRTIKACMHNCTAYVHVKEGIMFSFVKLYALSKNKKINKK